MIGPVTEPSDEAAPLLASGHSHSAPGVHNGCDACRQRAIDSNALAEIASKAITEATSGDLFVHLGLRYGIAHAVLDSPWLAARDERVAREAVEKALAEVQADVRQTLERNRGPKMQSPLGLAMACAIIAQHRQIRQATP